MSISAPVYDKADPKSEKLYPYHLPVTPEWDEKKDWFGQTAMMGAGAGMFLKNPMIVWACLLGAVISFVNYEPLRAPKDSQNPLVGLGIALMGVFSINIPKVIIQKTIQAPVSTPIA
ncbi:hypothetical protein DB88DRAFT_510546 [Papiliotrema laurentii]|uniref:Uncharacterized protein n=1 Tax=Papiliotrema laurentii TaxID=5418 RepID=A0AAD9D2U7_PAPLA|nr:hypothetical protein DB88DRAFT_510546 [Papiliotrema laurentii]